MFAMSFSLAWKVRPSHAPITTETIAATANPAAIKTRVADRAISPSAGEAEANKMNIRSVWLEFSREEEHFPCPLVADSAIPETADPAADGVDIRTDLAVAMMPQRDLRAA
jgi:hypothetical protein